MKAREPLAAISQLLWEVVRNVETHAPLKPDADIEFVIGRTPNADHVEIGAVYRVDGQPPQRLPSVRFDLMRATIDLRAAIDEAHAELWKALHDAGLFAEPHPSWCRAGTRDPEDDPFEGAYDHIRSGS